MLLILGLAGIRTVAPGTMYFEAFLLPWYALFVMVTVLIMTSIKKKDSEHISWCVCYFLLGFDASPQSLYGKMWIREGVASQYSQYTQYSQAIQIAIKPSTDSIFGCVGRHYLLGGQTHLFIPLSIYIPAESSIPRYQEMRALCFSHHLPMRITVARLRNRSRTVLRRL